METKLTCIIVDDEPLAQQLIEKFILRIPSMTILGIFSNAIHAHEKLDSLNPDVIFLDINMPEMSGFEFIRSFSKTKPQIIMTTAYPQYAIEGYEHDVLDYLLKPIPFDRFMRAINKVRDKVRTNEHAPNMILNEVANTNLLPHKTETETEIMTDDEFISSGSIEDRFLWVKEDRKLVKVDFDDIVHVEGMRDYLKIFLNKSMVVTHMRMGKMESILATRKKFLRINRSYIVNTKYLVAINGNMVELENGKKLDIGISYRDIIKNMMKSKMK